MGCPFNRKFFLFVSMPLGYGQAHYVQRVVQQKETAMNAQMELIASADKGPLTMSSREIASLVESRHDKVKQSIERLVARKVISQPIMADEQEATTTPTGGRRTYTTSVYRLEKRDSFVVVAQLSPEFTARLVDRWQELEAAIAAPANFNVTGLSPDVADMIERNFGITRSLMREVTAMKKNLMLIEARREDDERRVDERVQAKLSESAQLLRRGKTAKQIWDAAGLPPKIKGATNWFGNRLKEGGCMLQGRADRGDGSIRLFDPDEAETLLRLGLKYRAEHYAAERRGQGRLKLVPK